jgi:F-type H+-transporting ATPase subunit a
MRFRTVARIGVLRRLLPVVFALAAVAPCAGTLSAQGHEAPHAAPAADGGHPAPSAATVIMPHITDSKHLEYPCVRGWREWACELELPTWNVAIGSTTLDLGPTRHVVWMAIAAALMLTVLIVSARNHVRDTDALGRPRGTPAAIEAIVLYLRNEIYLPVLGHGGEKYFPFVLTLFFFIFAGNAIGMIPFASTPTGNVATTATLAIITFVMIEVAGMRELGAGYFNTIVYWPHDMPFGLKAGLTLLMTPIELVSKFTKPFALTIRLFANMLAGHVIILSLILLTMTLAALTPLWLGMAVGITLLEVLVVSIQAFIFSLLAAVFIGQIRTAHH